MKIDNMRLISGAGALVAKFDMIGQHLTIRGFGIFRKADGSSWISEPSSPFEKRDGTTSYHKHVHITDEALKTEIERLAKDALAELETSGAPCFNEEVPF